MRHEPALYRRTITQAATVKLIFIYGAPATGKLTVGKELARLTGYKLHHNHMAIDLALALFDYADPPLLHLCQRINLDVFDVAAQAGLPGLIFTFAYGGPLDDPFLDEVIRRFQDDVRFVHLSCDLGELKRRVTRKDRQIYKKLSDPAFLIRVLEAIDYGKEIRHSHHLAIDTTNLPPPDTARKIVAYFEL
jgi:hypothetical protein